MTPEPDHFIIIFLGAYLVRTLVATQIGIALEKYAMQCLIPSYSSSVASP